MDNRIIEEIITDFVFEVSKFRDFKNERYSKILLEVRLWLGENNYWQSKLNSNQEVQASVATNDDSSKKAD